ncbi:MAG: DUF3450 family protein [Lentisphaeria bacterium]
MKNQPDKCLTKYNLSRCRACRHAIFALLFLFFSGAPSAANPTRKTDTLQQLVKEWVKLQKETAGTAESWQMERGLLQDEVTILQNRRKKVVEKVQALRSQTANDAKTIQSLKKRNERLKEIHSELQVAIIETDRKLMDLIPLLPTSVKDALLPETTQLRKDLNGDRAMSNPQRLQTTVAVLKAIQKADNQLHTGTLVLSAPQRSPIEMQVLYIGLGQAFAVSPDSTMAARGLPVNGEWQWQWNAGIASEVAEAISILKEKSTADFVRLPFKKSKPSGLPSSEEQDK